MKFLLTADLHIHSHFNNPIFIEIGVNYLKYIEKYCIENKIKHIFILGDLFHLSSKIDVEVYIPIFEQFKKIKEKGLEIILIPGNHEVYSSTGKTILDTLSEYSKIYNKYSNEKISKTNFYYLPFKRKLNFEELNPIPETPKNSILLSHLNIAGFKINEYIISRGIRETTFFENFSWCFLGDLHLHQIQKNIVYTGSPYQQNFGESGQKKGFIVYDEETNKWERILYNEAPIFKVIKAEDSLNEDLNNCFVRLKITKKIDNLSKLREILYDNGALEVDQDFQIEESINQIKEIKFDEDKNLFSMIKGYIEQDNTKLKKEKLLETLDRIIEK